MAEYIYKLQDPSTGDTMYPLTTDQAVLCEDGGSLGDKFASHKNDKSNPHSVTKEQVGLGSVVNTGDSDTPVAGGTTKFTTGGAYTELKKKVSFEKVESLTEEYQAQKLVRYDAQSLSESEKLQARDNIGVTEMYDNLNTMYSEMNTRYQEIYEANWPELPKMCGQPIVLFGEGTPQESVVPSNWVQLNATTGEGYNWDGTPTALGQQYINVSVTSGGRYIAVPNGSGLKWLNF